MDTRRQRAAMVVTSLYVASAAFVLVAFLLAPPDGLANVWIAVWTLPVTLLGLALLYYPFGVEFPFLPFSGPLIGYYSSHAIYFVSAVVLLAWLLHRAIRGRSK